jgi:hypothetical protein
VNFDYPIEQSSRERELPPSGMHKGVITGIYNIGRIYDQYNDKFRPIVKIKFELATLNKFGKPIVLYNDYTASMHAKSGLRQLAHSLEGRDFTEPEAAAYSLKNFLGKSCQIQLIHKPKMNNPQVMKYKINAIIPAVDQVQPTHEPEIWDYRMRDRDPSYHCKAPRWIWESHMKSKDFIQPPTPYVEPVKTSLGQAVQQPVPQQQFQPAQPVPQQQYTSQDVPF